jgi:hypothetical protein
MPQEPMNLSLGLVLASASRLKSNRRQALGNKRPSVVMRSTLGTLGQRASKHLQHALHRARRVSAHRAHERSLFNLPRPGPAGIAQSSSC